MKILWITNILFPDICKELGMQAPVAGGWMYSCAKSLIAEPNIELAVATVYKGKDLKKINVNNITYFLIPYNGKNTKYCSKLETYWKLIQQESKPDVVHIHGTEFAHGLAYINACGNQNVIISIQGLVSVIERYYYAGLKPKDILRNISFRDIVRNDNIFQQRNKMRLRGEIEQEYLRLSKHVIGRTSWDKAHCWTINPKVHYHYCNETLREEFYNHYWCLDKCEKHSIFLSQAAYPIKGLHQVLKALPFVLEKFPDTKLYVAGHDFINNNGWKNKIRRSGYGKYIQKLINKLGLKNIVIFTGPLQEKEMCQRYLQSHLFICPSSIENSPNSLGEAQLLGVPCIASYVGGVPDMVEAGVTGLVYRFEEIEMLAENIINIFNSNNLINRISHNAQLISSKRHSAIENKNTLIEIYKEIL